MKRLLFAWITLLWVSFPQTAAADLQFCNRTSFPLYAAVGERPDYDHLASGWYYLRKGACRIVVQGDLGGEDYWAFAINTGQRYRSEGDTGFCVLNNKAFEGLDRDECPAGEGRWENFKTVEHDYADDHTIYFGNRGYRDFGRVWGDQGIEDDSAGGGGLVDGGDSCTASEVKMCGDPSASALANRLVPNFSDRRVKDQVQDIFRYGYQGYEDREYNQYIMRFLDRY